MYIIINEEITHGTQLELFLAHRKLRRTLLSQWGTARPESVPDADLEIRGWGRSYRPLEKGEGGGLQIFF